MNEPYVQFLQRNYVPTARPIPARRPLTNNEARALIRAALAL